MEMPEGLKRFTYPWWVECNLGQKESSHHREVERMKVIVMEMAEALEGSGCQGCVILTSNPPIPQYCDRCSVLQKFKEWK